MHNRDHVTINAIISNHPVTNALRYRGFSEDELAAIHFKTTHNYPFPLRCYPHRVESDPEVFWYCRVYATLKWVLTDPPWSPGRDAAYSDLAWFDREPDLTVSRKHREAQSERARRPRGRLTEDGETLGSIITKLARHHPDERPKNIWPHLQSKLDELGLNPSEETSAKGELQLHYDAPGGEAKRKTLTLRRFGTLLTEARKRKSR